MLHLTAGCFVSNARPFDHEALRRRSSFEIEFLRPDSAFQQRLWQETCHEHDIHVSETTMDRLARDFPFSPGSIHTICRLHAAGMGVKEERESTGPAWREDCLNEKGGIEAPLGWIRTFASRSANKDSPL
jgi:hypothetical protein